MPGVEQRYDREHVIRTRAPDCQETVMLSADDTRVRRVSKLRKAHARTVKIDVGRM